MKRILSIDGGGIRGLIPLTILKKIEEHVNKPIHEIFDLIVGSSIGAIIGGVLSTGVISCKEYQEVMLLDFPFVFKKRIRIPVIQPKYDRSNLKMILDSYLKQIKMKKCLTKFFCTSINYVDGRSHFFKSWEEKDGELDLCTALLRSAAAPLYFGKIVDYENKAVWGDGGCGDMNNPSMEAYIETRRQKWLSFNEPVHFLSLGCGQISNTIPFDKCKKFNNAQEISYFLNIKSGGLARSQISGTFDTWLNSESEQNNNFTYQRVEKYGISNKMNKIDAVQFIDEYVKIGIELAKKIDYTYLE